MGNTASGAIPVDASSSARVVSGNRHQGHALGADPGPGSIHEDEDSQNPYASFTVEENEADELSLWQWRWLGRIFVFRFPGATIYIGPHWFFSMIMLCFILGVGFCYCSSAAQMGRWQLAGGVLITILSTVTFLNCALSNPGVLRPKARSAEEPPEDVQSVLTTPSRTLGRRCSHCNVTKPEGCEHCSTCQVCVQGFDHHCPWMGKCIGKDNVFAFYTFIVVSMSSLAQIFIVTVILSGPPLDSTTNSPIPR